MFKTGLELTATFRWYQHDLEKSGSWLIDQGRLDPEDQNLLDRDGNVIRLQALYRISIGDNQRIEPAVRAIFDNHHGEAMANKGFAAKITYLYATPKAILDFNLLYGGRNARSLHPVYDEKVDSKRLGAAFTFFKPFKRTKNSIWSFWGSVEYFNEDSRIDFFDSSVTAITGGVMWKHRKK